MYYDSLKLCMFLYTFTVNLFFCLGHAVGAAGIYLSWDKNQDKEITKDEVSKFSIFMCMRVFVVYPLQLVSSIDTLLPFITFQNNSFLGSHFLTKEKSLQL